MNETIRKTGNDFEVLKVIRPVLNPLLTKKLAEQAREINQIKRRKIQ